jgi:Glucodextranase, domain B
MRPVRAARTAPVAAAVPLAAAALLAGCGAQDDQALPGVRLAVSAPGDSAVVRADSVEVTGRVSPARARVEVMGVEAPTRASGRFAVRVPLAEGRNVLDVSASARGRRPALAALRVTRDTGVTVPVLAGSEPDGATARLERLGLRASEVRDGGLLDHFRLSPVRVCDTEPAAGARVRRGAAVRVHVARDCG